MKKLITIVLTFASIQMSAQKVKDVVNPSISSWGTSFVTPVSDTKWSNANGKSYTKAKFAKFTGETQSGMTASADVDATVKLSVDVRKGTLRVVFEDESGNSTFDKTFSNPAEFTTLVELKKEVPYKVRFIGNDAKGSYVCQWIENKNL